MFQGSAISIPLEDYFREKLMEVKHHCMEWVDKAKKVQDSVHSSNIHLIFPHGLTLLCACDNRSRWILGHLSWIKSMT